MLHSLWTLQLNYCTQLKFYITKPRKTSCSRTSNRESIRTKNQQLPLQKSKLTASYISQMPNIKRQKYCSMTSVGLDFVQQEKSYQTKNTLSKNLSLTEQKSYTESAPESPILENLLGTIIRKLNGRLTIKLLFWKMTRWFIQPCVGCGISRSFNWHSHRLYWPQRKWFSRKSHRGTKYCFCPALLFSWLQR